MFTGIIESTAKLTSFNRKGTNIEFVFESQLAKELSIDQSLSHNGVCLTVEKVMIDSLQYQVTAIKETLEKTNLGNLNINNAVNLERCMPANGRFDGHIVQGHVDQIGTIDRIIDLNGSWEFEIFYDASSGNVTVPQGSICVNGVSLTVAKSNESSFSVAIIPYTFEHTTFKFLKLGDQVNIEFDIIGKYVQKMVKPQIQ